MKKFKKYIPQLLYLAAALNFIGSTIAAITGNHSGISLGIGSLCLCLAVFCSEKAKKNKE